MEASTLGQPGLEIALEGETVRVCLNGTWTLAGGIPATAAVVNAFETQPRVSRLRIEARDITRWDSALVTFVHSLAASGEAHGLPVELVGLPDGVLKLLRLARAVPRQVLERPVEDEAVTARVGRVALDGLRTAGDALDYLGETSLAFVALLQRQAQLPGKDLLRAVESAGVGALGIVTLISLLIGSVLAFVGAVQLRQFGATLYVANLVAIGITRELGALMTGIVMAGRSGAAFAAVLGTMTVNEEVDALRALGLRPTEFLVLPRVLATTAMLPALVVYADVLGILGGMLVGVSLLDVGAAEYLRQTQAALPLRHVVVGLVKGVAFGAVVSLTGCYYGIRCGRSAAAVGEATTKEVVMGIVLVVVVDALFTVALHVVGL
jgi:phospholipid/cholesterol/gamma-HCH transport system permease protein